MSKETIHNRISELLSLMEINHNRLILNESSAALDIAQLRSHTVELYTCLDQLVMEPHIAENKTNEKPIEKVETSIKEIEPAPNIADEVPQEPTTKVIEPDVEPEIIVLPEPEPESSPKAMEPTHEPEPSPPPTISPRFKPEIIEEEPVKKVVHVAKQLEIMDATREPAVSNTQEIKSPVVEVEKPTAKHHHAKTPSKISRSSQTDGDVFEQLRNKKLESIKKGIGIGKRYELQHALFSNNAEAYNEAMDLLDNADNLHAADEMLAAYAAHYNWDHESPLLEELMLLLQRRYI